VEDEPKEEMEEEDLSKELEKEEAPVEEDLSKEEEAPVVEGESKELKIKSRRSRSDR